METPQMKKSHNGGKVVITKTVDMHLFETEPMERKVFQRVGCLSYLQVLVEAAIENETPAVKESIAPLKKPNTTKRKNHVVPKEDPPSKRRSVRLSVRVTK
jgi:hypothetical protein